MSLAFNLIPLPVEMALEIVFKEQRISFMGLPIFTHYADLGRVFLQVQETWRDEMDQRAYFGVNLMTAQATIEKTIEMLKASTRFQRSKEGKAIREFLELRLRMLMTRESAGGSS